MTPRCTSQLNNFLPRREDTGRAAETATKPCLPLQPRAVLLPRARFVTAEDYEPLPVHVDHGDGDASLSVCHQRSLTLTGRNHTLVLMLTVLPAFVVGSMKGVVSHSNGLVNSPGHLQHFIPHSPMPKRASQSLWIIPLSLLPSMAPHSISRGLSHVERWTLSHDSGNFFKIIFLISVVATAVKSYAVLSLRRKRKLDHQTSMIQEKEPSPSEPAVKEETQPSQPEIPHRHLHALRQELSQSEPIPVFPWIAPPTQLPGPYDAPFYPLPSIRRDSHDASDFPSEKTQTMPYIRRISTDSMPTQESTIRGTTTVSNHGWRRTQWTVASG
ncbi:hypothetical protein EK21DRAFT_88318 [Setomelanomma holmii]|uniref:Uncharacterized protein n=1 Tax=Setomelanomma holmii TaxID=210430 RepID=A0A9P4LNF3_9PLEO|nr:hypothetical protein EK21DRAFT_88318 [Setomelanomma holmii]